MSGLPDTSASRLLGVAILLYFAPIGFILAYSLTATVGALAFKRADEALVEEVAIVKAFPPFPDLPVDPNPEQIAAANTIAARAYRSLTNAIDKATWARAQSLLKNYPEALRAYQDAIVLDPRNPALLLDYAVTIYNDPSVDNIPLVLSLLTQAEEIAGSDISPTLRKRMLALRAVATLYQPGGYETTIALVNGWILSAIPTTRFARFYRACGFGQLYESCAPISPLGGPPYVQIPAEDASRLMNLVHNDIVLTIVAAQDNGRDDVRMVIDPSSKLREATQDNDLQMLAADDIELCQLVGMTTTPPPSTAAHPLPPVNIPNPLKAAKGELAAWINANCPT